VRLRAICVPEASSVRPWPTHSYRAYRDLFTVVGDANNFLVCDLERREATGFFSSGVLEDREHFREMYLEAFTYMTLQRHWVTPVHAACVVRDGLGICLAGGSGSGKSTLAYACVKAGYSLLSENEVFLLNSGDLALHGNPARMRLRPSTSELFPELRNAPTAVRDNGEPYLALLTQDWFPDRLATRAEVGPLVFLDRQAARATADVVDVSAEEARRLLFEDRNAAIDEPHVLRESERAITRAVRDGAYRMRYSTLQQALDCLRRLPLLERTAS